jgi:hypothetical protein
MKKDNMPNDLKPIIIQTFKNVYQIAVNNLSDNNNPEKFKALDYLQSVCEDVDKYFAYEHVFGAWQKRVDTYFMQHNGADSVKKYWCKQQYGKYANFFENRFSVEEFNEMARRNFVDTPANIVESNVRYALPRNGFYRDFCSFCSCVEKYLCYGDVRHPQHNKLYIGDTRLWGMMKPFVDVCNGLASSNRIKRWLFKQKLKRHVKGM